MPDDVVDHAGAVPDRMLIITRTALLEEDPTGGGMRLFSTACRRCLRCVAGRRDHCLEPLPPAAAVIEAAVWPEPDVRDRVGAIVRSYDAVRRSGSLGASVGVIGASPAEGRVLSAALGRIGMSVVVSRSWPGSPDARDRARSLRELAGSGARLDIVISLDGDLEAGSLAVRRGGLLVSGGSQARPPKIGTLVQRELAIAEHEDVIESARACFPERSGNDEH